MYVHKLGTQRLRLTQGGEGVDGQGGTHGGQGAARRVGRAVRAPSEDVGVGLASRVHAPGDGRGNGKCDI